MGAFHGQMLEKYAFRSEDFQEKILINEKQWKHEMYISLGGGRDKHKQVRVVLDHYYDLY